MGYMYHRNFRQRKLLDSTAVAENRITGGVGEVTGAQSRYSDPISFRMFWSPKLALDGFILLKDKA